MFKILNICYKWMLVMRRSESMKNIVVCCYFVLLSLFFTGCKNEFSGKKYAAELMGVEVIGLDFLDNSKIEIYFAGMENQVGSYSYDKLNQKVKIIDSEIELDYTPSISVLKWQSKDVEFVFHLVEEINVSTGVGFDFHPPLTTPIPDGYVEVNEKLNYYTSLGVVKSLTNDGKEISIEISILYQDDAEILKTIENKKDEIIFWLKSYISGKMYDDFSPPAEPSRQMEIRNGLNETLFQSSPKIRKITFMDIY